MGAGVDVGFISITYPLTHTSTHPINWVAGTCSKPFLVFLKFNLTFFNSMVSENAKSKKNIAITFPSKNVY
jgi:hypothetical protein